MMRSPLNPSQDAAFFRGRLGRPDLPFLVFSFSIIMVLVEDALQRINPRNRLHFEAGRLVVGSHSRAVTQRLVCLPRQPVLLP